MKNLHFTIIALLCLVNAKYSFSQKNTTYCNPINIDYGYTPIPNFTNWGKHRATADPVIVNYKGTYFLFSTNQWGYWYSDDLSDWKFLSRKFLRPWNTNCYDELCAPAVGIVGDTMLVFGSTYTTNFTLWMSTNPTKNEWKPLVDSFEIGGWDPAFFTDDDGRFYMYNGSSNRYPLYGIELDRKTFKPKGTRKEMYFLESWRYGWQRFGENLDDTFLDPFIEGAWMTKHNHKYYLQYGAPGTEFSHYSDGVAIGDSPLGWFGNQSDPLSMKSGGYARGAGHGATFQDNWSNYWHVSTIAISTKNNFERRIGIWPAGFDKDDLMYCNTAYGDYPHYLPNGEADHSKSRFTGWMLLNYKSSSKVSSTLGNHSPNNAVDENIKTYWSAKTGDSGEFIEVDLSKACDIKAIQINYADQDAEFMGKSAGVSHKYILWQSLDGIHWEKLTDKSNNDKDVPHDYIEYHRPVKARFIKLENIMMPTGKFAISGLRIFGNSNGDLPNSVSDLIVLRTEKDKRSAWLKWNPVDNAQGYVIYYGTQEDKLYTSIMVYDQNEYWLKTLDKEKKYYFKIEAFNENGRTLSEKIINVD
ncbi:MAG: family 43 glycosylhydrolase [Saprospiraceae bacterium]|nr:family 43 glycosylhydrolase [Saprospiraceae bacterium]